MEKEEEKIDHELIGTGFTWAEVSGKLLLKWTIPIRPRARVREMMMAIEKRRQGRFGIFGRVRNMWRAFSPCL